LHRLLFERGPDEEGIETDERMKGGHHRSNADLMKKGLRLRILANSDGDRFERGPDEEGIETVRHSRNSKIFGRSNADLMKKGLRPAARRARKQQDGFERGPDEEGIETFRILTLGFLEVRTRT